MEMQNITLSLSKRTLKKIKLIAVQRQTSVSGLLTKILDDLVDEETGYSSARRRQLDLLEQGLDLRLGGEGLAQRETLHER